MWILDSYYKGSVELWSRERGLSKTSAAYPPSFYMHLKDPHAHWEMIESLESCIGSKSVASILSSAPSRDTESSPAEKSPRRSRGRHYAAELYIEDVRQDQRYLAKKDCSPAEKETSPGSLLTSEFP